MCKLQSNHHHQQTNTQLFTSRMRFLSPIQQCQSTEGKNITFHGLAYPKLIWGLPTLSLTTNSSWLPWGGLPCPHQPSDVSTPILIKSTATTKRYVFREHLHTITNANVITSGQLLQNYPAA